MAKAQEITAARRSDKPPRPKKVDRLTYHTSVINAAQAILKQAQKEVWEVNPDHPDLARIAELRQAVQTLDTLR